MKDAGVDGALIVQPINHKFDHSYVTRSVACAYAHILHTSALCTLNFAIALKVIGCMS